jgi:DNA-binding LacI/PurR family transcriptional regulator
MVSLRTIAEQAGVSSMTVSRALRNDPHVHPDTRQRIMELAEVLHYRPNRLTHSLRTGTSMAIGCLVPHVSVHFYDRVLQGIVERAFADAYHTVILQTHSQLNRTCQALQVLVEQRVGGVLIAAGHSDPIPRRILYELWSHNLYPVLIDNMDKVSSTTPIDQVMSDERALAEMAVEYLMKLGHRNIGYIGPRDKRNIAGRNVHVQTMLQHHRLRSDYCWAMQSVDDPEEVRSILQQLVSKPEPPTAVIAGQDMIAARILQLAPSFHLRIPWDLSVLGCGNLVIADYVSPALTTIEQCPEIIGRMATELLLKRFAGQQPPNELTPEVLTVPSTLVERQSCAHPRRKMRLVNAPT